jgi:hypothetical protein
MQELKQNTKILTVILFISVFTFSLFWINSKKSNTPIVPPTSTSTPPPKFEVIIPSKGLLKNYVTVSVKAETGTSCNLIFIPASGETLNMNTIADENDECVWRWKLEESYGRGSARLIFTINGISQTHFLQILESF